MTFLDFQIELAIRLALQVYHDDTFVKWAEGWISSSDRNCQAAYAAANAAYAAANAAAAANDAADAAARAADAAAYAADAAAHAAAEYSIKLSINAGAKLENVVRFL